MSLELISGPQEEPVSLDEMKQHLNIDEDLTDDDDLIEKLITAARIHAEKCSNIRMVTQQWRLWLECFPYCIEIPIRPLVSVESIKYLDSNGALQTVSALTYEIDAKSFLGKIRPVYGSYWPVVGFGRLNAVQVNFTAGLHASLVGENLKSAIKLLVGHLYENRETTIVGNQGLQNIPLGFDALLMPDRAINV